MLARLEAALSRAAELERELANPATVKDPSKLKSLGREYSRLQPIKAAAAKFRKLSDELAQAEELRLQDDAELVLLAEADIEGLGPEVAALEADLLELLIPHDPMDDRDVILFQ